MHPLHRIRVNATNGFVQHNAAEYLDPRHRPHRQRGTARGFTDVILQHDAAHAARLGNIGHVHVIHVAAKHVGMRMHMHIDNPCRRADLGRRRRKGALCERLR